MKEVKFIEIKIKHTINPEITHTVLPQYVFGTKSP